MEINKLKEKEEERLKHVQVRQNEELRKKGKYKKLRTIVFALVCMVAVFLAEIIWANMYVSSISSEENISASQEKTTLLSALPGGKRIIDWRIRVHCKKTVNGYNNGSLAYEEADILLENYSQVAFSEKTSIVIDEYKEQLSVLNASKGKYELACVFQKNEDYLQAMDAYQEVSELDSYYQDAAKSIKSIKDEYKKALIAKACDLIDNSQDYNSAQMMFQQAAEYFPKDKTFTYYKQAGEDCGNPLIYSAVVISYEKMKTFEKDVNHTKAECNSLQLYAVSDTVFVLAAGFHLNSPPGCYFYYLISADGTWEELSGTDFSDMVAQNDISFCVDVDWSEEADSEEKLERLYSGFVKLGPKYDGTDEEMEAVSLSEIQDNNTEMEERTSDNTGINLVGVVVLQLAAVIIAFLILKSTIQSIFK